MDRSNQFIALPVALLISVGALAAVPLLVKMAMERINRPESERGSRNRLRSIRGDSGYPSETDVY
jgi:hypothetical protein